MTAANRSLRNSPEKSSRKDPLRLQRDLLKALGTAQNLTSGLQLCVRAAVKASGMDCGGVYLAESRDEALRLACHQGLTPAFVAATTRFPPKSTQAALVREGRPVYTDASHPTLFARPAASHEGLKCQAFIPFRRGKRVIGCLTVSSHERDSINAQGRSALEAVASAMGGTVSRLKAEEELKQSELRYRRLLNASSDSIVVLDHAWRVLVINRAALRFLGLKQRDVLGRSLLELLPDIRTWSSFPRLKKIQANRAHTIITEAYRLADGRSGWFQARIDPVPEGTLCLLRDVTAVHSTERRLHENQEHYRSLFDAITDALFVLEVLPDGSVGRFLEVNDVACRRLGYSRAELLTLSPADIDDSEQGTDIGPWVKQSVVGKTVAFEQVHVTKDGRRIPVSIHARAFTFGDRRAILALARDLSEHKRSQAALAQSEKRFRALIEHSSDAISLIGADGRVIFNGPSYQRIMGYDTKQREGKNALDLVHPDDRLVIGALFTQVLKTNSAQALPSVRVKHANGTWRWIEGVAQNLLADPGVGAIVVNFRDITERKQAEEALTLSEARFRDLTELLPQIVYEVDKRGRLTYVNQKGFETTGYTPEDLRDGFDFIKAVAPADRERMNDMVVRILQGEKTQGTEYTLQRKDGSTFPVLTYSAPISIDNKIKGIRGLIVNVSDRKIMEKELARTKAILEQAIAQTPIPMVLATAPDNIIRMVNAAAGEIMGGAPAAHYVGRPLAELERTWEERDRHGAVVPPSAHPLAQALRGKDSRDVLLSVRRADGTTRWELVSGSPIRDASGDVIAAFAVFPDVTETILAEEELKQRLAVEQLAAEVSADFVNLYAETIDAGVTRALKKLAQFSTAGCATLSVFSADEAVIDNSHEWAISPAESQFSRFPRCHLGLYQEYLPALRRNRTVVVSRHSEYPARILADRHRRDELGFRSFLITPLFRSGALFGILGLFGETDREINWSFHTVTLIGFVGDMLTNLLDRKRTEKELTLYREHLEELVSRRTEELERSRSSAVTLMEAATVQRQRAEEALHDSTRMAEALKESQTRLRLATKSAKIGIVETDLSSGELLWDEICAAIHGLAPDRPVTLENYFAELVHPKDRASVSASLNRALASPAGHWGREYRILKPGGEVRWLTEDHFILRDEEGHAVRMIGAKQDVTARTRTEEQIKTALNEKETLLREIHHRVKNNLNTISNLLYFQSKLLDDERAVSAFRESQNRIQSMARIHEHLYRSWDLATVDMKAYLSDLIVELAQTYGAQNVRIDLSCEGVALDIDRAVPCGLIMNELVSNAMKYAFTGDRLENRITIRLDEEPGGYVMEVADNGRGLKEDWNENTSQTLGIRLVTMFCKQLAGAMTVSNTPGSGAGFRIAFPKTG